MFQRLPRTLRKGVRDSGICHYLAVFRQKDGSLVQVRRCGGGSLAAGAEAAGGWLRASLAGLHQGAHVGDSWPRARPLPA